MTYINLTEFIDYDIAIMTEFLKLEKKGCYDISIRYDLPLPPGYVGCPFYDYMFAAYIGHLLSLASTSFSYAVPARSTNNPFRFQLHSKEHLRIAAILCDACKLFYDDISNHPQLLSAAVKLYNDSTDIEYCVGAAGLMVVAEDIAKENIEEEE